MLMNQTISQVMLRSLRSYCTRKICPLKHRAAKILTCSEGFKYRTEIERFGFLLLAQLRSRSKDFVQVWMKPKSHFAVLAYPNGLVD